MITPHQAILQKNARINLIGTLENFSDRKRQEKYKQAVPFVHVPRELLAQWDEYSRLLKERRDWFIQSLTEREITAMLTFDAAVEAFPCDGRLLDVPEILDASDWVQLMHGASQLLVVLNSKRGGCEQGAADNSRCPFSFD